MKSLLGIVIAIFVVVLLSTANLLAQTSGFSYQGNLVDMGTPANGTYIMTFSIWDAATGGTQIGETTTEQNITAVNGIFTTSVIFDDAAFTGSERYLEIALKRTPGESFTLLAPRQEILSAPYSVKSKNADTSTNSSKLGGVDAARFVQSDTSGNVSVGGDLSVTGSTSFDTVNAATQFNLGGERVLSSDSSGNLNLGTNSGTPPLATSELETQSLSSANLNTVLGNWAGAAITTGAVNTFVGYAAGNRDDTGTGNSFIGHGAGFLTTSGNGNTFVGNLAGTYNITGLENSYFGAASGGDATAGSFNTFSGTYAGFKNHQDGNSFFGYKSGYANTSGDTNAFFGYLSGLSNTVGFSNTFVGSFAGQSNVGGDTNSFFGRQSGFANVSGSQNSFFGRSTGYSNTTGSFNTFYGVNSGNANTLGSSNAFFGNDTGTTNTTGDHLSLFGFGANVGADGLTNASAIGANAVVSQSNSLVLGNNANVGIGTSTPTSKLSVAGMIETTTGGIKFPDGSIQTTAGGGGSGVTDLNGLNGSVNLAAGPNVTITPSGNTLTIASTLSAPAGILNQTTQQTSANFNIDGTGTANIFDANQYYSLGYRVLYSPGESTNLYVGRYTGVQGLGANDNTFLGTSTGRNTTTGGGNTFVGANAGYDNIDGGNNTFLGSDTGSTQTGSRNTLIGAAAGDGLQTGSNNTALGAFVHLDPNLNFATAIGAGSSVTTDNTIVIGRSTDTVSIPGTLTKAAGSFRIDHPLDPKNKYLYHSFVESPDMMNVYNGNITTDASGDALVMLPLYFEALNKDFRYQLTVIGTFAQAIISEEVSGNKFKIKTNKPNVKVSWQVTGIRKDPYAEKNRIVPEVEKPAGEKGKLQNPEAFEN